MEIGSVKTFRSVSVGLAIVGQLALAGGLIAMLVLTTRGAIRIADPAAKKLLLHLAWLSLVLLLGMLLMIAWSVVRYARYRLRPGEMKPSTYVNAWELAGKRFQLADDEEDDEEQDRDAWNPDGDDPSGGA